VAAPSPTTQAWDVSHGGRFAEEALVTRHGGGSGGVRPATTGGGWLWAAASEAQGVYPEAGGSPMPRAQVLCAFGAT